MGESAGSNGIIGSVPSFGRQPVAAAAVTPVASTDIPLIDSYRGWSASNHYISAAAAVPGAADMVASILFRNRLLDGGGKRVCGSFNAFSAAGWDISLDAAGGAIVTVVNGAGTGFSAGASLEIYEPLAIERGRLQLVTLRYVDGTPGTLECWINGGLIETTSVTGGGFTAGSIPFYLGFEAGFSATFGDGEICGVGYFEGVSTADDIVDSWDETAVGGAIATGGTIAWDNIWTLTGAPPASLVDSVGAVALTRVGSLTAGTVPRLYI